MRAQLTPNNLLLEPLGTDPANGDKRDVKKEQAQQQQQQQQAIDRAVRGGNDASLAFFSGEIATSASPQNSTATKNEADVRQLMKARFAQEFGAKAADPAAFHAFMAQVYGDNYDHAKAEQFRQRALQGDYSWLPEIRFVSDSVLQHANGAF